MSEQYVIYDTQTNRLLPQRVYRYNLGVRLNNMNQYQPKRYRLLRKQTRLVSDGSRVTEYVSILTGKIVLATDREGKPCTV